MLRAMPESKRLEADPATLAISYTAGQYLPVEYRAAVKWTLKDIIWQWARTQCECDTREKLLAFFKRNFSRSIVNSL